MHTTDMKADVAVTPFEHVNSNSNFEIIEEKLTKTFANTSKHYKSRLTTLNQIRTRYFYLFITWGKEKLIVNYIEVTWEGEALLHCDTPAYLGVTLDRILMYKYHCEKTSKKINTRNGLLRKLTGSKWGAQAYALRVSAIALCFSIGEYACEDCEVWGRSTHVKK